MSNQTLVVELRLGHYQMFISRPSSYRPDEFVSGDVLEAGLLHPAFKERSRAWLHAVCFRNFEELPVEFVKCSIGGEGAIRRGYFDIKVDALNVTSWFCVSEIGESQEGSKKQIDEGEAYSKHWRINLGQSLIANAMNRQWM